MSSIRVKKTTAKPEISDQIGRQLRSVYNDVLSQPVPDRFLDLLKDIDAMAAPGQDGASASLMDKKVAK